MDWRCLRNETPGAYKAFLAYLEMDPADRSIKAAADASGANYGTCKGWSSRYQWRIRSVAYDQEIANGNADKAKNANEAAAEKLRGMASKSIDVLFAIAQGKITDSYQGDERIETMHGEGTLVVPTKDRVGAATAILDRAGLTVHETQKVTVEGIGGGIKVEFVNEGHPDDKQALAIEDPLGVEPGPAPPDDSSPGKTKH